MSTLFKNIFGNAVTENQAVQLDTYHKVFEENGEAKIIEEYYKGALSHLSYYKAAGETHAQILALPVAQGKFITIIEKTTVGFSYVLEKSFTYNAQGVLESKGNELFDPNRDLVGHEWIGNPVTGPALYESTKKYFYDRTVNPDTYLFECFFKANGTLDHIYYNNLHLNPDEQDSVVFHNTAQDIQALRNLTGMSQQLADYYVSPNVIPNF